MSMSNDALSLILLALAAGSPKRDPAPVPDTLNPTLAGSDDPGLWPPLMISVCGAADLHESTPGASSVPGIETNPPLAQRTCVTARSADFLDHWTGHILTTVGASD